MRNYLDRLMRQHDRCLMLFYGALLQKDWDRFKTYRDKLNKIEHKFSQHRISEMLKENTNGSQ